MAKGKAKAKAQASTTRENEAASEYEKQRQERIRENQARLEALGLPALSSSLLRDVARNQPWADGSETKRRRNDDDDYRPSDEGPSSHSESESEDDRKDRGKGSSSSARRRSTKEEKNRICTVEGKARKKLFKEDIREEPNNDDNDTALAQAIALSLEDPVSYDTVQNINCKNSQRKAPKNGNEGDGIYSQTVSRGKRKKENIRRVQMTEDEAVAYYFSFDEAGKGSITFQDLQRMSLAHDFSWSDKEIADMICLFDSNCDGKLDLNDFQKIISRCNLLG